MRSGHILVERSEWRLSSESVITAAPTEGAAQRCESAVVRMVPRCSGGRRRRRRDRAQRLGSRTKAQVRTAPRRRSRPEPSSSRRSRRRTSRRPRAGRGRRPRWRPAPQRRPHPPIASTPDAIPTFSARHRRHRRDRHRRVDEAERDPEQQVAGEQRARRSCRRPTRVGRAAPRRRTPCRPSSAARAPKRAIRRPEKGEMKTIGAVIGRISSPLRIAEWPRTSCRYWGWKNITRPVGADEGEGSGAGAEVGPVAEQARTRRSDWAPGARSARRRERGDAGEGERDDQPRAPFLRLDQGQDDRGQPGGERRPGRAGRPGVPAPGSVDSGRRPGGDRDADARRSAD